MYALPVIQGGALSLDLPHIMYKMPVIQGFNQQQQQNGQESLSSLEERQDRILSRLSDIQGEVNQVQKRLGIKSKAAAQQQTGNRSGPVSLVIHADPKHPPYGLICMINTLKKTMSVDTSSHSHSSLKSPLPENVRRYFENQESGVERAQLRATIIWKEIGRDPQISLGLQKIQGESTIARYVARQFPSEFAYESDPAAATRADEWMDAAPAALAYGATDAKKAFLKRLNAKLGEAVSLVGKSALSFADFVVWSSVMNAYEPLESAGAILWAKRCNEVFGTKLMRANPSGGRRSRNVSWRAKGKDEMMTGKATTVDRERKQSYSSRERKQSYSSRERRESFAKERRMSEQRSRNNSYARRNSRSGTPGEDQKRRPSTNEGRRSSTPGNNNNVVRRKFSISTNAAPADKRQKLLDFLEEECIDFSVIEHPAVATVREMVPYLIASAPGATMTKNFFLKDKNKKLFLLSAKYDAKVDLAKLSATVGAKDLRFAPVEIMKAILGVEAGALSPFSLIHDKGEEKKVTLLLDDGLTDGSHEVLLFHPMVNNCTVGISCAGFGKFLRQIGHKMQAVTL